MSSYPEPIALGREGDAARLHALHRLPRLAGASAGRVPERRRQPHQRHAPALWRASSRRPRARRSSTPRPSRPSRDFVEARQQRLTGVITEIPNVLWYAVLVGAAINLILLFVMLRMRLRSSSSCSAPITAFFLGVILFVIVALDDPLRGEMRARSRAAAADLGPHDGLGRAAGTEGELMAEFQRARGRGDAAGPHRHPPTRPCAPAAARCRTCAATVTLTPRLPALGDYRPRALHQRGRASGRSIPAPARSCCSRRSAATMCSTSRPASAGSSSPASTRPPRAASSSASTREPFWSSLWAGRRLLRLEDGRSAAPAGWRSTRRGRSRRSRSRTASSACRAGWCSAAPTALDVLLAALGAPFRAT